MVAGCGVIIAEFVEPLIARSVADVGGVAGEPGAMERSIPSGCAGIGIGIGMPCASPAGIGISGGKGSVTGGVGFEGSGIGLGLAGSSVSPGIGCDPSDGVEVVCAKMAGVALNIPMAMAPMSNLLRMIFLLC